MRPMAWRVAGVVALLVLAGGLGTNVLAANCSVTSIGERPLMDLGTGTYHGFEGGLYPGGGNDPPLLHAVPGLAQAAQVAPVNGLGAPDPLGAAVFLSIGMSNTRQHFAAFVPMSDADPERASYVRPVNGAIGGQHAGVISNPNALYWQRVDELLAAQGHTPEQVQVVWMLQAVPGPRDPFPEHAEALSGQFDEIIDILDDRFPNLRLVYLSNRIYAGYASTQLNPEPWAYENAFAAKWTIERRMDPVAALGGPWVGWGPDLWADGLTPRSDGLIWECRDLAGDGTHPSALGAQKAAGKILEFLHEDPIAGVWYKGPV